MDESISRTPRGTPITSPSRSRDRLEYIPEAQFPRLPLNLTVEKRNRLKHDCQTIFSNAMFFCALTELLYYTTLGLKTLIAVFFASTVFISVITESLLTTSINCLSGKEKNCYTKFMQIIFPVDMVPNSPHLEVTLKDSGRLDAGTLYAITIALTISNPIIHLAILGILFCCSSLLKYFNGVLRNIARLARDSSPDPNFRRDNGRLLQKL